MQFPLGAISYNSVNWCNFERTDTFSLDFWVYGATPRPTSLVGHMESSTKHRGWLTYLMGSRSTWNTAGMALVSDESSNNYMNVITQVGQVSFAQNTWHHIAFTYNGSSDVSGIKCYVDGVSKLFTVVRNTLTDTIRDDSAKLRAGYSPLYQYFPGRFDELAIYDRTLSAVEVGQRYNAGAGTETLFGTSYLQYHLNEASGSAVADSSGNVPARDGHTIGSPTWAAGKLSNCVVLNGSSQYVEA